ncbi:MAG: hypothetical protein A2138_17125 [Deltaproteobacteria bacterium RBG_16_71_12]|nr:MAG: hypothetical protein A2138_17125 [Deltaproteobacteria bacterium RBG_16_71_12]
MLLFGLATFAGPTRAEQVGAAADGCAAFDHQHGAWQAILAGYVRHGVVDYAGLKRAGQAVLAGYLRSLESACRESYDHWTREQKLAFWINAYNAYTVRLILDHHPVASIRSIGFLPGAAFRERFIPLHSLRDRPLSLDDIEHEILRKELREPRIHFAIVCASKSCPALAGEAYRAATLDQQLDQAARAFLADPSKNRFDAATRTLHLSAIFDWFREDFERSAKTLPAYVARYAEPRTAASLSSGGSVRIEFLAYDWSLNGS